MNTSVDNLQDRLWNRRYIILFALNVINNLSFYLMSSSLVLYTKEALLWNDSMIGFFGGFYAFAALVFRPIGGIMSDKCGTRLPMLIGNVLMVVSALCYGIFKSYPALLFARFMHGAAFSLTNTSMTAAVASALPKSRLSEGIGYYGIAMILAQSIAPGWGLSLADIYSFISVFNISSIMAAVGSALMVFLIPKEPRPEKRLDNKDNKKKTELIAKECLGIAVLTVVVSSMNGIFSTYLVLSAGEAGINQAALSPFYLINGAAVIATRLFTGRLIDRKSPFFVLMVTICICIVSVIMVPFCKSLASLCAAGFLKGIGTGIGIPTLQAACFKRVTPDRNGLATGTYYIGADVGNGAGPMAAGVILSSVGGGYGTVYFFSALVLFAGAVGLLVMKKRNTI